MKRMHICIHVSKIISAAKDVTCNETSNFEVNTKVGKVSMKHLCLTKVNSKLLTGVRQPLLFPSREHYYDGASSPTFLILIGRF